MELKHCPDCKKWQGNWTGEETPEEADYKASNLRCKCEPHKPDKVMPVKYVPDWIYFMDDKNADNK